VLHISIASYAYTDISSLCVCTVHLLVLMLNTGVDADGGYSQDKRALRGASTTDKTSSDTADLADTSSSASGNFPMYSIVTCIYAVTVVS
jgi:hypothetical protein